MHIDDNIDENVVLSNYLNQWYILRESVSYINNSIYWPWTWFCNNRHLKHPQSSLLQCQHQLMLLQSLLVRTHRTIERIHAARTCTITTIHCMERTFQMMYFTRDNSICSGAAPHSLPAAGLRLDQGTYDIILVDLVAYEICYPFRIKISITKRKIALNII